MNTLLFALFACGEKEEDTGVNTDDTAVEETETEQDELAYIGTYTDAFGGEQIIAADTWTSGSFLFHISQYSNDEGFVIAQNDSEARSQYCDDWSLEAYTQEDCETGGGTWIDLADKWSRFDIFSDADGGLHYCQIAFDADTEEDALAVSADASDLAAGCNGFGWSQLLTE